MTRRQPKTQFYKYFSIFLLSVLLVIGLWSLSKLLVVEAVDDGLKQETRNYIDHSIEGFPNIVGIQVVEVNLRENSRHIVYTKIMREPVRELYETFVQGGISAKVPFFTRDQAGNQRLVKILNHEYICTPYIDTISYKYLPETANYISSVCAISVPPNFGIFKGIVAIYLEKEPTQSEIDYYRVLAKEISVRVDPELRGDID